MVYATRSLNRSTHNSVFYVTLQSWVTVGKGLNFCLLVDLTVGSSDKMAR